MAEIHVQPRKKASAGTMWIWILVALLIIGAVAYYVFNKQQHNDTQPGEINHTSWINPLNSHSAIDI